MPSTYSSNLKIELMSTGENSGTWGNITNTNLGTAMEQAVVGYGNPDYTSDANLTITLSNSNAAQAARALVLNVTSAFGSLTATRELVVPTSEKQDIVQNNTTGGQSITVKTSAGTGITVPNGRKAHLYVDGTNVIQMFDFVDINGGAIDGTTIGASSASTGAFTTLNASGATTLDGNVTLGNASGDNVTVTGTITSNLLFTDNTYDIGASGATRPRNLFLAGAATIGGNLSVGGTLTLTGGVNLNGNVTVGDASTDTLTINSTITSNLIFTDNTYDIGASGATRPRNLFLAGSATISGSQTLTGALTVDSTTDSSSTTTGSIQTDGGLGVAKALFVGTTANVAGVATLTAGATIEGLTVGRGAGAVSTNTAVGASALSSNSTGAFNSAFGVSALAANTTNSNTAFGYLAAAATTTGTGVVAVGRLALNSNTTGDYHTAVGNAALYSNTTGSQNTAVGDTSLYSNTTGNYNTAVGMYSLQANTTASNNTAVGYQAGYTGTTTTDNVFVGYQAGYSATTGTGRGVFIGKAAGYATTTGTDNIAIGYGAGNSNQTGIANIYIGGGYYGTADPAGFLATGSQNTFVGFSAGNTVTTGAKNTILGAYNGNQDSLDIRTGSNYVVLSDGDGNRQITMKEGQTLALDSAVPNAGTGITFPATQSASSNANTLDDYEEGDWTPTDVSGAGLSFTVTGAFYTKVGNLVTCWFELAYPATGSSAPATIGGLPFASKNVSSYRWSCGAGYNNKSINDLVLYGSYNSSALGFYISNGNGATNSSLSSGLLACTFSYQTA